MESQIAWASIRDNNASKCCYMQFTQAKIHRINKVYYLYDTALAFLTIVNT